MHMCKVHVLKYVLILTVEVYTYVVHSVQLTVSILSHGCIGCTMLWWLWLLLSARRLEAKSMYTYTIYFLQLLLVQPAFLASLAQQPLRIL